MFVETVTFTHTGSAESVLVTMAPITCAVGFTNDSGNYVQCGQATEFRLMRQSDGSNLLGATIYSDGFLDFDIGRTFTITGFSAGTLTAVEIERAVGFPFFF